MLSLRLPCAPAPAAASHCPLHPCMLCTAASSSLLMLTTVHRDGGMVLQAVCKLHWHQMHVHQPLCSALGRPQASSVGLHTVYASLLSACLVSFVRKKCRVQKI